VSSAGRAARLAATVVALSLLLAGTAWGEDDHFPFGPFKMYARSTRADGRVAAPVLVAVDGRGVLRDLRPVEVGLRPAELEGQLPRLTADPTLLAPLAPDDAVELRLVSRGQRLKGGRPDGPERDVVVAVWRRP
jgi:hypothetical protein